MNIKIFDVDHGFCAAIEADELHTVLVGCGYGFRTGFRPARYLLAHASRHLDSLILPAYTEEHLIGFLDLNSHFLERYFSVDYLITNPSISASNIPELGMRNPSTGNALRLLTKTGHGRRKIDRPIEWGNARFSFFWNSYPDCLDIQNLSLVTILSYQDIHIIFPGDLKTEGWQRLLKSPEFCDRLRQVNLFVASNYGHEDGYCPDVFDYCTPDLVIISNHAHRQLPPFVLHQYASHARGLPTALSRQKVLTTRDAGTITIHKVQDETLQVTSNRKVYQYQPSSGEKSHV